MSPTENEIMRAVEDHYWWYQALRPHVAAAIQPTDPNFSLLDAGCGTGGMLKVVRERFPAAKLTGLDQSTHALELTAARNTGAQLVPGNVHHLPFPEGSFDVVLSLDVLSSIGSNPLSALREASRVLRPGGTLILNVAALEFLKGEHDCAVDADRRYTQGQLRVLLEEAGFRIKALSYWNATFTPPIAIVRWLSRARLKQKESPRSDFQMLPSFVNAILRNIAALELNISRYVSLPFGTSLFVVARKNG
jgi:ubiquinone/menaquinone biosynthesis C-methylase UbiE